MSRELFKMNMIASVQKLDNEDIEIIQNYIETIEQENKQLKAKSEVLEENNKLLIQQKAQMYEDLDIAYERIDKAIEYIKENFDKIGICVSGSDLPYSYIEELLEILGENK